MLSVNLKSLVEKMTTTMRASLENAAGICVSMGHYNVEIEHWLLKLLEERDSDLVQLLKQFEIPDEKIRQQLNNALERFRSGSTRPASLSPEIVEAAKNAWMIASIDYHQDRITSGHLLVALLSNEQSRRSLTESLPVLSELRGETVREGAKTVIGKTGESAHTLEQSAGNTQDSSAPGGPSKTPALDRYTVDLTSQARNGQIDEVLGRDEEIRQCIDILTRRRQNNPILTGEAGVGKTAVVEGFAMRIAKGDVPTPLQGVALRTLDLGLLQAGASVKGEFENRLKSVIEEVKASPTPIILFIDEAHTLIGAGGKEGQGDAANLLKPALARGELRTIAATTWAEYKKYFERDPALTRRFQVVNVGEPDETKAIDMMRSIAKSLEKHHGVRILDDAITASVRLSHRYIPARQLPDKSVSLLDTACARVALSQSATPSAIEDSRRRLESLTRNKANLARENAATGQYDELIAELAGELASEQSHLEFLETQWQQEHALVEKILDCRRQIEQAHDDGQPVDGELDTIKDELRDLHAELNNIQGEAPLMQANVGEAAVADVIANWTGIPVGKMVSDDFDIVQNLSTHLGQRVIGQDHALDAIARIVRTSRAGLSDPRKPQGVFLMVGTSGVGKTETALALADLLYGGEQNLTVINMSEFKEEHKVSMLLGSPPGYVGYGEGGVLTEAARRKPYSVILLDEMEKAHPGVQDIFYNLFDKGTIKDGEGRDIDFKNTTIIMTSNAGEDAIREIMQQVEDKPEPDALVERIRPALLNAFKPAFLGRTSLIAYYPLADDNLMKIAAINMQRIEKRVRSHYGADFSFDEDVLKHIVARCKDADTGARNIENILSQSLLPELASQCLQRMAGGEEISKVHIGTEGNGAFSFSLQ
ncbi:type VI secretion system ATPase TssH [Marinobacter sp. chi1]|uniref:Type VI secretion system ATPase TssH n=1 Tax=Marinobacter suaedae TaxID=3057675 RepID=A0ABT8VW23_9GAMM|nr:type VI secretion system ATPase TssH [Marinobacter sp. chi1]MDO3720182.1 type VI secretion system ATPase TssH [Marinobacter sp. chi1]